MSEVYTAHDLAHAKRRLIVFFQHAADADVPELTRLAHTVDRWRDEILAFHTTGGASNGPTEAVNLLIEKIRRLGHGYRNFTNYRRRLLLGCGITWDYRPHPQNPRPPTSLRRVEPVNPALTTSWGRSTSANARVARRRFLGVDQAASRTGGRVTNLFQIH